MFKLTNYLKYKYEIFNTLKLIVIKKDNKNFNLEI